MTQHLLIRGDARRLPIADRSVHCVVTSPPYFGLRSYLPGDDPHKDHEIGLEPSPAEYVAAMVVVFREVRRVLRDDGVLWLNLGDSYAQPGQQMRNRNGLNPEFSRPCREPVADAGRDIHPGLAAKQRLGIPHRVVFALQEDGWIWRDEIVWAKSNPMPESVKDRTTKAHEMVFLLTKRERYFYDADAIREPHARTWDESNGRGLYGGNGADRSFKKHNDLPVLPHPAGANARSLWVINPQPYPGAHFATWPPRLVERMIRAGTSEKGCCSACGAPWARVTETDRLTRPRPNPFVKRSGEPGTGNACPNGVAGVATTTRGWGASCDCGGDPVPAVVLDPFSGSGTTLAVATGLGRRAVGTDLNPEYLSLARRRVERPHQPIAKAHDTRSYPLFAGGPADA